MYAVDVVVAIEVWKQRAFDATCSLATTTTSDIVYLP